MKALLRGCSVRRLIGQQWHWHCSLLSMARSCSGSKAKRLFLLKGWPPRSPILSCMGSCTQGRGKLSSLFLIILDTIMHLKLIGRQSIVNKFWRFFSVREKTYDHYLSTCTQFGRLSGAVLIAQGKQIL